MKNVSGLMLIFKKRLKDYVFAKKRKYAQYEIFALLEYK